MFLEVISKFLKRLQFPTPPSSIVQTVSAMLQRLAMETIRGAQQTYNIAMEAEERQSLVKTLIRLGVGLPSIEE